MRSYGQYCALAKALDVIGDRWSILIIRNLLLGPQRWSDLQAGLPGIAKNLLSGRLAELIKEGVLAKDEDSYRLTDKGRELEAPIFALANWGERHVFGPPQEGDAMRLRYFITAIRRKLRPTRRRGWVQLHVAGEPFAVRLGPDATVVQGEHPTTTGLHTDVPGLRALVVERLPPAELVTEGRLAVRGDLSLVEAFAEAVGGG